MELNQKLAEWRWPDGYRQGLYPQTGQVLWGNNQESHWVDFPHSLDVCLEWLVPKLSQNGYFITSMSQDYPYWFCIIEGGNDEIYANADSGVSKDETPALALCKAIEKLIDREKS